MSPGELEEWRDAFYELVEDQQPTEIAPRVRRSQLPPGYHYETKPQNPENEDPENLSDGPAESR